MEPQPTVSTSNCGICIECGKPNLDWLWCQTCNKNHIRESFNLWTSGNKIVDTFIQEMQLSADSLIHCFEWIPMEKLRNLTFLAKGYYGNVYTANWVDGLLSGWDYASKKWRRYSPDIKVVIKTFNNSKNITAEFLEELKAGLQFASRHEFIIRAYGLTRIAETGDYAIVHHYCIDGALRHNLSEISAQCWNIRMLHLRSICEGLAALHSAGLVHGNLHSGNVMAISSARSFLSDIGLCKSLDWSMNGKRGIYGILPYVAPEVLRGQPLTPKSDIYGFAIMMWELSSGRLAFEDFEHDELLALKICAGIRPEIISETPIFYVQLIQQCWDPVPENRPSSDAILQHLKKWTDESCFNFQIKEPNNRESPDYSRYTTRLLPDVTGISNAEIRQRIAILEAQLAILDVKKRPPSLTDSLRLQIPKKSKIEDSFAGKNR